MRVAVSAILRRTDGVGTQAVLLAGATGIAQVLVGLIYLFAARGSDPKALGLAVSAIALGTSSAGYIDFGTNSHWVREIARGSMATPELGHRLFGKLSLAAIAGVLWAAVTAWLIPASQLWIAAPVMWAILANQTSQVPLRGATRGDLAAVVVITDRVVAAIVFFILIGAGAQPMTVLWLSIVVGSMTAALVAWLLAAPLHRPAPMVRWRVNPWSGAKYFGLASLANSTQGLDLPLLAVVSGPTPVGIYGAVSRWTQPMGLLAGAFASASAPFVARSHDIVAAWTHLRRGLWMPGVAILIALSVFIGAPWIVQFLLGHAYAGSSDVLRVLALVSVPSIISQPAIGALQALGRDRFIAYAMMGTVAMQLVLVAWLGGQYGAFGAALASLAMQIILLGLLASGLWREIARARRMRENNDRGLE